MSSVRRLVSRAVVVASVAGFVVCPARIANAADGDPSSYFGVDGSVVDTTALPTGSFLVAAVDDSVGSIYIGFSGPGGAGIVKYTYDGARDLSFGNFGIMPFAAQTTVFDIAVRDDGSIVVGGHFPVPPCPNPCMSFTLAPTVGIVDKTGHITSYPDIPSAFPPLGVEIHRHVTKTLALPDGRVLLAGITEAGVGARVLEPNGVIRPVLTIPTAPTNNTRFTKGAIVLSDGHVLVQVQTLNTSCQTYALTSSLSLDAAFGVGGVLDQAGPCAELDAEPTGTWLMNDSSSISRYSLTGQLVISHVPSTPSLRVGVDGTGRILVTHFGDSVSALNPDFSDDLSFGIDGSADLDTDLIFGNMHVMVSGDILFYRGESLVIQMQMLDDPYGVAPQPFALPWSSLVPVLPERVLDTRIGLGAPLAQPGNNATLDVQITGLAGVPDDGSAVAVVLNVTAAESTAAGFVSVWPTGGAVPTVSSLNYGTDGRAIPNLVTVALGAGGRVSLYTYASAELLVDVLGYYKEEFGPTEAGRFQALTPERVVDTRNGIGAPLAPVAPGGSIDVQLTGVAGIPDDGVSAVAFNLTATRSLSTGYLTVYPKGATQPDTSNLNVVAAGTRANFVIAPVGDGGKVTIFNFAGGDVIVDVVGWFTDDTADERFDGLFVPILPRRIVDSRYGNAPSRLKDSGLVKQVGSTLVGPAYGTIGAAVLNFTLVNPLHWGYITVWPTGLAQPNVSSLNVGDNHADIANAAIVVLGVEPDDFGGFQVNFQTNAHLIVDMVGYYLSYSN